MEGFSPGDVGYGSDEHEEYRLACQLNDPTEHMIAAIALVSSLLIFEWKVVFQWEETCH